jgi:hypothetical protein
MEFGFIYRLTFPYYTNPRGRYEEISDRVKEWFTSNAINWGMGALGGSRVIYGDVQGPSGTFLQCVREQFAEWLSGLPMCCSVALGPMKPTDALDIMDTSCELAFVVDNLTEEDRRAALAYHAAIQQRAKDHAKKPASGTPGD